MTEEKKFNITVAEQGISEIVIREGAAEQLRETKPPVKQAINGVINVPFEYLLKRLPTGQFSAERSYLIVDREKISLTLVINEDDFYNRDTVRGTLEFNPKFVEFGINTGKVWQPAELAMFIKMNRAFFADKAEGMKLVSELKNFTATVNNQIERAVKENGDRADVFRQTVDSNLPEKFTLQIPVFKGYPAEHIEIETFAQIDGREVRFTLISPSANELRETILNSVIDGEITKIRDLEPRLAIIEV